MSLAIGNRIGRLRPSDRLLLVLIAGWSIAGIPGNYFRVHGQHGEAQFLSFGLAIVLWAAIAGVIAYSVIRRRRRPADYGFSFQRGGIASLAILALIHAFLAISGRLVLSATGSLLWSTIGAFMEELAFRAIATDTFILLLDGLKGKACWAILASTAFWLIPHIASKPTIRLPGIFLSGLILGYVYYKSRSILLPAWIHVAANAGYLGGVLVAGLYCLIATIDSTRRCREIQMR
jgi:membrane protease YdiL (CAAX protease family)